MREEVLGRFGVRLLAPPCSRVEAESSLEQLEEFLGVSLPPEYRGFLMQYRAPFAFKSDVVFRALEKTPWQRRDGTQSIVSFYGLGRGEGTLSYANEMYGDRMPPRLLAIAELPGGNQLCLCCDEPRLGQVFLWDHEAETEARGRDAPDYANVYLVARSFDDFISGLMARPEPSPGEDLGVIDSESSLDF